MSQESLRKEVEDLTKIFEQLGYHGGFYLTDGEGYSARYFGNPDMIVSTMIATAEVRPTLEIFREVAIEMRRDTWIRQAMSLAFKDLDHNPDKTVALMVEFSHGLKDMRAEGITGDKLSEACIELIEAYVKKIK